MVARDLTAATLVTGLFALMLSCLTPEASSLVVSPASATLQVGDTVRLHVIWKGDLGTDLAWNTPVTWSSSDVSVAIVNGSGLVTGVAAGTAAITVTSEGRNGTATVTALPPPPPAPVASVIVSPASSSLQVGGTVQLLATLQDANGVC